MTSFDSRQENIRPITKILKGESDLGVAVVGGVVLENAILELIGVASDLDSVGLIRGVGLGQKAEVARALGLMPDDLVGMLKKMKGIRDEAAHLRSNLSVDLAEERFSKPINDLAEMVKGLGVEARPADNPRELLENCIVILAGYIDGANRAARRSKSQA